MIYFHAYDLPEASEGVTELALTGAIGGVLGSIMGAFSKNRMRRDLRDIILYRVDHPDVRPECHRPPPPCRQEPSDGWIPAARTPLRALPLLQSRLVRSPSEEVASEVTFTLASMRRHTAGRFGKRRSSSRRKLRQLS